MKYAVSTPNYSPAPDYSPTGRLPSGYGLPTHSDVPPPDYSSHGYKSNPLDHTHKKQQQQPLYMTWDDIPGPLNY